MSDALLNSAPVLLAMLLGLISVRIGMIPEEASKSISKLLFNIFTPPLIFIVLYGQQFGIGSGALLFLTVITLLLFILAAFLAKGILKLDRAGLGATILLFTSFAVGSFAYPFIQLNFGSDVFSRVVLVDITLFLIFMTVGYFAAIYLGKGEKMSGFQLFKTLFLNPIVLTIAGTVLLNYFDIALPKYVHDTVAFIATPFAFMAAFLLGMTLKVPSPSGLLRVMLLFVMKLSVSVLVYYAVLPFVALGPVEKSAFLLSIFTPYNLGSLVIAKEQELDTDFVSQSVLVSVLFYIVAYPLLIAYLR